MRADRTRRLPSCVTHMRVIITAVSCVQCTNGCNLKALWDYGKRRGWCWLFRFAYPART